MEFKKIQLEMLHRVGESSEDEGKAGFDRDEGPAYDAKTNCK